MMLVLIHKINMPCLQQKMVLVVRFILQNFIITNEGSQKSTHCTM